MKPDVLSRQHLPDGDKTSRGIFVQNHSGTVGQAGWGGWCCAWRAVSIFWEELEITNMWPSVCCFLSCCNVEIFAKIQSIAWNTSSCNCPIYAVCSILNWLVELFFSKNFWYFLQSFLETFRCGRLKRVFVFLPDALVSNWKRQRASRKEITEVYINTLANDQAPWISHTVAFEAVFISFLSDALAAMLLSCTPWRTRSALLWRLSNTISPKMQIYSVVSVLFSNDVELKIVNLKIDYS